MLDPGTLKLAASALALTTEVAIYVIAGGALGSWLDGKLGTGPVLLLTLALAGLAAGFFRLVTALRQLGVGTEDDSSDTTADPPDARSPR